ncbi:MAG: DUF485 domain-containing protein [Zoogloeaceae bacterium]|nr:DUF485 domain-containing protein [Zoogloeaceae bacterium]
MTNGAVDWAAIGRNSRFEEFRRRKRRFFIALVVVAVGGYAMLSLGAAFLPDLFRMPVAGALNIGMLFALVECALTLIVAVVYAGWSSRQFDHLAEEINREIFAQHARSGRQ